MLYLESVAGNYLKTHILPPEMDAITVLCLPASETSANEDIYINLESVNGIWRVKNDTLILQSGSDELRTDKESCYAYSDDEKVLPITMKLCDFGSSASKFEKFDITAGERIVIGSSTSADIRIFGASEENTAVIEWKDNAWVISGGAKTNIYVNNRLINGHRLQFYDLIYIDGVRMIFLGDCLAVNEIGGRAGCTLTPWAEPQERRGFGVKDGKVFYRSPRLLKKIVPQTMKIDPPPSPKRQRFTPFMLQVGASLSMSAVMLLGLAIRMFSGSGSSVTAVISTITILGSLMGMIVFPKKLREFQQKRNVADEQKRLTTYQGYLAEVEMELSKQHREDSESLFERYPSLEEQASRVRLTKRELWEKIPKNVDFLDVRFGIGNRNAYHRAHVEEEGFTIDSDAMWADARNMVNKYSTIKQVPLSLELTKETIIGIFGRRPLCMDVVKSIIFQTAASHSYNDVKLVCLCDKEDKELDFVRWLPHAWNEKRNFRYIIHDNGSLNELLDRLAPMIAEREERREKGGEEDIYLPHYVVICASEHLLKNEVLRNRFLDNYEYFGNHSGADYDIDTGKGGAGIGISFIVLARRLDGLPISCNTIVQCTDKQHGVFRFDDPSNLVYLFKPDSAVRFDLSTLSRQMFSTRTLDIDENRLLPEMISFLDMYNASSIENLHIEERWSNNRSENNIRGSIGVTASNNFLLDIHEKAHGPHGLIAGTTGSGKSEFIQTLILSLAINYHPDDISFIIIDYKGGGTVQSFKETQASKGLPHMGGYITNLDGNQIQRSLLSLRAELRNRQKKFDAHAVTHIDKYQRLYRDGKVEKPMPHLIIVADEFAELKQNKPEFMNELISTARIGRSLGVHLILATQRPGGIVNEQIVSNTRFRICLKVASKEDSREVLDRDEAAEITNVGRAYVMVGNGELFTAVQTGWSGAAHLEEDDKQKMLNKVAVHLLDVDGHVCHTEDMDKHKPTSETPSQLRVIVDALASVADKQELTPLRLWMPPLEDKIYLSHISAVPCFDGYKWTEKREWLSATVGVVDDVEAQEQRLLNVDFGNNGHAAVYGQTGAGKSTFMQTLVYSFARSYSPDKVNFYIIDCAGRSTKYYNNLPHVGDVCFLDDDQKIKKLFMMLDQFMAERQKHMESSDSSDIRAYVQKNKKTITSVILIIRNVAAFMETYGEKGYGDKVYMLIREGARYGIYLLLIANAVLEVKMKIQQYINATANFCFQLTDTTGYYSVFASRDLTPESLPGRGLVKQKNIMEFHAALAVKPTRVMEAEDEAIERIEQLKTEFSAMRDAWLLAKGRMAPAIPAIPISYTIASAIKSNTYIDCLSKQLIPIGYDLTEIELACLDLENTRVYPVVGGPRTGKTNFMKTLLRLFSHLFSEINGAKLYVIDNSAQTLLPIVNELSVADYAAAEDDINTLIDRLKFVALGRLAELRRNKNIDFPPIVFIADDFDNLYRKLSEDSLQNNVKVLSDLMKDGKKLGITQFISIGRKDDFIGTDIIKSLFMYNQGILMGGNYNTYNYFNASIDYKKRDAILEAGHAYSFDNGFCAYVRTPLAN